MSAGEMPSASTRGPSSARPNAPTCLPAYCARLRDRRQAPASLVHMLHLCDTYACAINLQSNKLFPTRPAGRVSSVITEVVAVGLRRCQHGPRECDLNRVLNCAQQLSSNQASARGRPPRPCPFHLHHSAPGCRQRRGSRPRVSSGVLGTCAFSVRPLARRGLAQARLGSSAGTGGHVPMRRCRAYAVSVYTKTPLRRAGRLRSDTQSCAAPCTAPLS